MTETNQPTRDVLVTFDLTGAYETWIVRVPADADKVWVEENLGDCEYVGLEESGNRSMDFTTMEEIT